MKKLVLLAALATAGGPVMADTTAAVTPPRSPVKAVLCSLVPGGGQAYNRKWLKAGVIFTGSVGLTAYRQTGNDREMRDTVSWWLVGLYIYNLLDAYIDAHLDGFDREMEENIVPAKRRGITENNDS